MSFKIYTKTGDNGETSLFGGKRVMKDNSRLDAYGKIDELNSFLGFAKSTNKNQKIDEILFLLQNKLFSLGSDLATPIENEKLKVYRISEQDTEQLERIIDELDLQLPEIKFFILPGGSQTSSILQISRTICREAERKIVKLNSEENINKNVIKFVNRLSDLLFIIARYSNFVENIPETKWTASQI